MKSKWLFVSLAMLMAIALIVGGCSTSAPPEPSQPVPTPAPAPEPQESYNLRFTAYWPEKSPNWTNIYAPILADIEAKTNGRITFTAFPGGALGGGNDQYDIVRTGKADMGISAGLAYAADRFPMAEIFTIPGAYENSDKMHDVVLATMDEFLAQEHPDVELLGMHQTEVFYLYTADKQIKSLDDMKGLKIRAAGGFITDGINALGAEAVGMPLPDLYVSLQTGVVDGGVYGPSAAPAFSLYEVTQHELKQQMGYSVLAMVFNKEKWSEIPADLQEIIRTEARKAGYYEAKIPAMVGPKTTGEILDGGGTSTELDAAAKAEWASALAPLVEEWVGNLEGKGIPAQDLVDFVRSQCQENNIPFPY